MLKSVAPALCLIAALSGCATTLPPDPSTDRGAGVDPAAQADAVTGATLVQLAPELTLAEWRKAENQDQCAPVVFTDDGGVPATARSAYFGGGWAVAFDTPTQRSAYGIAGVGLLNSDKDSIAAKRAQLQRQWPYFKEPLAGVPLTSFAGYGIEGALPYPDHNPSGRGADSLAYVRIAGQRCMYNVWSKVSRAHLELLLDRMHIIDPSQR